MVSRFQPGDRVRVRAITPDGHCRTPFYIRGKTGRVTRDHGDFRNPEQLAYGLEGLPKRELFAFRPPASWRR